MSPNSRKLEKQSSSGTGSGDQVEDCICAVGFALDGPIHGRRRSGQLLRKILETESCSEKRCYRRGRVWQAAFWSCFSGRFLSAMAQCSGRLVDLCDGKNLKSARKFQASQSSLMRRFQRDMVKEHECD